MSQVSQQAIFSAIAELFDEQEDKFNSRLDGLDQNALLKGTLSDFVKHNLRQLNERSENLHLRKAQILSGEAKRLPALIAKDFGG